VWDNIFLVYLSTAYAIAPEMRITVKPAETAIVGNSCANMHAARQRLSSCHTMGAKDMHATTEQLPEVVFSVWSMPRLHNKGQSAIGQDITCCISLH
jgi:hypothetical protein